MTVRPVDANAMLNELRPLGVEAEHSAVLLSDVSKMMREWVERQPTLTPPNEPERDGLYGKYTVYKNKDGSLVTDCFILRPAKDPAAVAALRAYAATTDNAELASDIINWVGAEPSEPLTLDSRLTSKMVTCPKGWKGVRGTRFYCPGCKKAVKKGEAYCHKCGQALIFPVQRYDKENNRIWLDFSNRRPPEGEGNA